jgi:hypothetical protein
MHNSDNLLTHSTAPTCFDVLHHHQGAFSDTQRKLPDDDVRTSKHAGAVECVNKLSEQCNCWYIA